MDGRSSIPQLENTSLNSHSEPSCHLAEASEESSEAIIELKPQTLDPSPSVQDDKSIWPLCPD